MTTRSENVECRYFRNGECFYGSECKFKHSPRLDAAAETTPSVSASEKSTDECRFFNQGYCRNGLSCRFVHKTQESKPLCEVNAISGICQQTDCPDVHGDICEYCDRPAIHPTDSTLRMKHIQTCKEQNDINRKNARRNLDKTCEMCLEKVMEKSTPEQKFGLLQNCDHCFCLSCIKSWRAVINYRRSYTLTCPTCRHPARSICPSKYWVESQEEKHILQKTALIDEEVSIPDDDFSAIQRLIQVFLAMDGERLDNAST